MSDNDILCAIKLEKSGEGMLYGRQSALAI